MDLLHAQFNNGRLSLEEIKICLGSDFGSSWPTLQKKFKQDEAGLFFNERAEQEKQKRQNFTDSRKNNLKKSHMEQHMEPHMVAHMENRNINENIIDNWDSIKLNFFNDWKWKEKFCLDKKIQMTRLEELMTEFINDTELKEDFKVLKDLKNHFTNKFNKNGSHKQTLGNKGKQGTSEARTEALKNW